MISNDLYSWDPATLAWANLSDFAQKEWPSPRHSHGLAAEGNVLYVFGGYNGSSTSNDFYSYNDTSKKWNQISSALEIPTPRSCHGFTNSLGYLYLFGGRTFNG